MRTFASVCRGRIGFAVLLSLLTAISALPAQAQTKLRWKFKPGESVNYEMVMDISQDMSIQDMQIKSKMVQNIDMVWKAQSVNKDGSTVLDQTIERVRVEMAPPVPGQPGIKFDSAAEKQDPTAAPFAKIFGTLVGHPSTITISPLGKVSDIKLAPEMLELAKQVGPGGASMVSEDSIKEMISRSMFSFPEVVKPNQTWENTIETANPLLGKQIVVTKYTYLGPAEFEGRKVEKIGIEVDLKFEPGPEAQAKVEIKDQSSDGAIYFDNQQGLPVETKINTKMTMQLEAGGQSLEQVVNTDVKVKQKTPGKE